jgi:hypothetical protein
MRFGLCLVIFKASIHMQALNSIVNEYGKFPYTPRVQGWCFTNYRVKWFEVWFSGSVFGSAYVLME